MPTNYLLSAVLAVSMNSITTAGNAGDGTSFEAPSFPSQGFPPSTATTVEASVRLLNRDKQCAPNSYPCGSLCCPSPGTCSVDVTANFHCCSDRTFCAANTTNTPVSAGNHYSPRSIMYLFIMMFSIVLAADNIHDMFEAPPAALARSSDLSSNSVAGGVDARTDSDTTSAPIATTLSQLEYQDDCAGCLWKELRQCCVKGTLPHYYMTGERGCCPQSLDGQSDSAIEAACPAAQGQANLKPLGDGVMRSQAARVRSLWAEYIASTFTNISWHKLLERTSKSNALARATASSISAPATSSDSQVKRQIIGPGCGGFDPDCQQTCPAGWATCETSAASSIRGLGFLSAPVRIITRVFAFMG